VDEKKEAEFIRQSIEDFSIKPPSPEQKTLYLSGGNQQKIILARWLAIRPKLVIFDEPTKGIDVGAKAEIYQMICDTAGSGAAVILISSELPEVIGLSDRILVMKEGRVRGEILQKDATEALVLSYAMMSEMEKEETNAEK
jgi:ABC-type sugar transport system, ATPase component